MLKIGKHRNPAVVIILTIASFGLYSFAWFVFVLEELRKYRGKGASGLVPIAMIIISSFIVLFFGSMVIELFLLPIGFSMFFVIYLFALPYLIEMEIDKLKRVKQHWYIIAILLAIAFISYLIVPNYVGVLGNLTLIEELFGYFLLFLMALPGLFWIYYIQKRLNLLWSLADVTNILAIPEKQYKTEGSTFGED